MWMRVRWRGEWGRVQSDVEVECGNHVGVDNKAKIDYDSEGREAEIECDN